MDVKAGHTVKHDGKQSQSVMWLPSGTSRDQTKLDKGKTNQEILGELEEQ